MAGGVATLLIEFLIRVYTKVSFLASFAGLLVVGTLLAAVAINAVPANAWDRLRLPVIPAAWVRYIVWAALAGGFLFGWLRW